MDILIFVFVSKIVPLEELNVALCEANGILIPILAFIIFFGVILMP